MPRSRARGRSSLLLHAGPALCGLTDCHCALLLQVLKVRGQEVELLRKAALVRSTETATLYALPVITSTVTFITFALVQGGVLVPGARLSPGSTLISALNREL